MPTKEFLYNSINEATGTIRSLDTKSSFLIVFLALPITSLSKIFDSFSCIYKSEFCTNFEWVFVLFLIALVAFWVLAFFSTAKTVFPLNNPAEHIRKEIDVSGCFYEAGNYTFRLRDIFINDKEVKSRKSLEGFIETLPPDDSCVTNELSYELMKLVYIRDVKMFRQKWSYIFTLCWLITGFLSQITSLILK